MPGISQSGNRNPGFPGTFAGGYSNGGALYFGTSIQSFQQRGKLQVYFAEKEVNKSIVDF
jgi:hypothetical protein